MFRCWTSAAIIAEIIDPFTKERRFCGITENRASFVHLIYSKRSLKELDVFKRMQTHDKSLSQQCVTDMSAMTAMTITCVTLKSRAVTHFSMTDCV